MVIQEGDSFLYASSTFARDFVRVHKGGVNENRRERIRNYFLFLFAQYVYSSRVQPRD